MPTESDVITNWESSLADPEPLDDQAVGHLYQNDDSEPPPLGADLAEYADWPSVASTVYTKLYSICDFDPATTDFAEAAFSKLRRFFATSPYWNAQLLVLSHDFALRPGDYRPAVEAVADLGKQAEVTAETTDLIVRNVKRIAQLASRPGEAATKKSLFHSATIAVIEGEVRLLFLYASVPQRADAGKGRYRVGEATVEASLLAATLDLEFCRRHAERIKSCGNVGVADWAGRAAANAEPENTSKGWPAQHGGHDL